MADIERPQGPRVAGLADPRLLNATLFSGYEDVIVRAPLTKLTEEDLNDINDVGMVYYADDDNDCANKPESTVKSFGMWFDKVGGNQHVVNLLDGHTNRHYRRTFDGTDYGEWSYVYTSDHKPHPSDLKAIYASKTYERTVDDSNIPKIIATPEETT